MRGVPRNGIAPRNKVDDVGAYLPTLEEIQERAWMIREVGWEGNPPWSEEEYYRRTHNGVGVLDEV